MPGFSVAAHWRAYTQDVPPPPEALIDYLFDAFDDGMAFDFDIAILRAADRHEGRLAFHRRD